jgi:drug/metabolite transporter (DMT)-like permease
MSKRVSVCLSLFLFFLSLLLFEQSIFCGAFTGRPLQYCHRPYGHNQRDIINTRLWLSPSSNDSIEDDVNNSQQQLSEKTKGLLVLLTVPMAWGTFEPAIRLVYQYQDVPPLVFSLAYYLPAATVLGLLSSAVSSNKNDKNIDDESQQELTRDNTLKLDDDDATLALRGGIELGTYLFVGNALQVIGLKTVASDRAAFLLQLTTIFVPLVQSLLARNFSIIPIKSWFACFVALSGVALIGLDSEAAEVINSTSSTFDNLNFSFGDYFIMLGALFYSFHCVRLETFAKTTSAVNLAAAKAITETVWSGLVVSVCLLVVFITSPDGNDILNVARSSGEKIIVYTRSLSSYDHWTEVILATIWTGLVPVAYTIYSQSYGQSRVPPATANLIYTCQPFFTALIAFLLLGEKLGPYGYAGGALIGSAVLLVNVDDNNS